MQKQAVKASRNTPTQDIYICPLVYHPMRREQRIVNPWGIQFIIQYEAWPGTKTTTH